MSGADHFLARWSRLKRTKPAVAVTPVTEAAPATAVSPAAVLAPAPDQADAANRDQAAASPAGAAPAVALPDPASLTLDSDFTAFLKDEVGEGVRRQALKKLFNDPHFNVMDGLDIYIGDYSVSEPIPPELLAKLRSASEWLAGREDEGAAAPSTGVVKDDAALATADDVVGDVVGDEMDSAMGDAMGGTADGTHVPAGAMPAAAVDKPAAAAAEWMSAASPPAPTPAAVPAASAADTVKRRQ